MSDEGRKTAHELRNLLGLVALEVHAARATAADAEATRRSLDEIAALIQRCSEVIVAFEASTVQTTPRKREIIAP